MKQYIIENWSSVLSTFIQIVVTCLAGYMARFALKSELRSTTEIKKKEAQSKIKQVYLFTFFGIILQLFLAVNQSESDKDLLETVRNENTRLFTQNERLKDSLLKDNRVLKSHIDGSTAKIIGEASRNALSASTNLLKATNELDNLITGTSEPPMPSILGNYMNLRLVFRNDQSSALINTNGTLVLYDKILNCRVAKKADGTKVVDEKCVKPYAIPFEVQYVPGKSSIALYDSDIKLVEGTKVKYYLDYRVKNQYYSAKVIIEVKNSRVDCFVAIYIEKGFKETLYKYSSPAAANINWGKEFPINLTTSESGQFD
jgi:hypothetical protein